MELHEEKSDSRRSLATSAKRLNAAASRLEEVKIGFRCPCVFRAQ